jgi:hypothetical protein
MSQNANVSDAQLEATDRATKAKLFEIRHAMLSGRVRGADGLAALSGLFLLPTEIDLAMLRNAILS